MKWVFWSSVAVLFYMYCGYPLWLWLRSRYRPWPIRSGASTPSVSIVMVVRNEAAVIERKLRNLLGLSYPPELTEIIVVSDASTDSTNEILRSYSAEPRLKALFSSEPQGKAAGLNDAVAVARGEVVLFTDARQAIEDHALELLVRSFADPDVGCASGELMLGNNSGGEHARGMGLYWRVEKTVRELESRSGSVIGATGALYAVKRELVVPLPPNTILDDVYIPMHAARQGGRVIFVPHAHAWDIADQGTEREFSRKVRTLAGNYQLLELAPWLLSSQNPLRFEFISHKLLRLFAPFALAAALISSLFLPQPLYRAASLLQLAFYLLSLMAMLKLARGPLARVADAAGTFVVLNSAAVVAFVKFVTGRRVAWVR
jgi:poly-beta-1,6-N-acetyl-D-glucosamine synthase